MVVHGAVGTVSCGPDVFAVIAFILRRCLRAAQIEQRSHPLASSKVLSAIVESGADDELLTCFRCKTLELPPTVLKASEAGLHGLPGAQSETAVPPKPPNRDLRSSGAEKPARTVLSRAILSQRLAKPRKCRAKFRRPSQKYVVISINKFRGGEKWIRTTDTVFRTA